MTIELPLNARREKTCKKCKITYRGDDVDIAFFRRPKTRNNYFSVCRLCEQDERTEKARENRWKVKARRTRQSHARKLGISTKQLEQDYGWDIEMMAHEAEHGYKNGCPECHGQYSEMDGGLGDISLDIRDREIEPEYTSNTAWICKTCNLAKGTMSLAQWAKLKRLWRQRKQIFAERSKLPQLVQMDLFSCLNDR